MNSKKLSFPQTRKPVFFPLLDGLPAILVLTVFLAGCATVPSDPADMPQQVPASTNPLPLWLKEHPGLPVFKLSVDSQERRLLMADYAQRHYGSKDSQLENVVMVVIHTTAMQGFQNSFAAFRNSRLDRNFRADISSGGDVNVGVHFLVAPDGTIAQLLPLDVMGRHTVGFNHLSFGIEIAAKRNSDITREQIISVVNLVHELKLSYPSIIYILGHHEYMNKSLAHFQLFRDFDNSYKPPVKVDPGARIMAEIRGKLKENWNLGFLD